MNRKKIRPLLADKYPPSLSCSCNICQSYCSRPGWWTVQEATRAIEAGYWKRMMLELSPDFTYGVLSPAFKGCEQDFAIQEYSKLGCNFYSKGMCELYDTGLIPLECRFCHHLRKGLGEKCHHDIGEEWNTPLGHILVNEWILKTGVLLKYKNWKVT